MQSSFKLCCSFNASLQVHCGGFVNVIITKNVWINISGFNRSYDFFSPSQMDDIPAQIMMMVEAINCGGVFVRQ